MLNRYGRKYRMQQADTTDKIIIGKKKKRDAFTKEPILKKPKENKKRILAYNFPRDFADGEPIKTKTVIK